MMRVMPTSNKFVVLFFCLCGFFLSSCTVGNEVIAPPDTRTKQQSLNRSDRPAQPATEVIKRDVMMPVMSSINNRIHAYEQKMEEWRDVEKKAALVVLAQDKVNRIDECRSQLQHILIEYTALQKQLQQETRVEAAQLLAGDSLLQLNQQDIDYLESGCNRSLTELKTTLQPAVAAPADPQIKTAFEAGNYELVINLYSQTGTIPGQLPAAETSYQYGQALLKNHQEAEARKVLADVLARTRQQKGQDGLQLQVMQTAADLDFALASYDEAKRQYEEVVRLSIEQGAHKEEWSGLQLAALQPGGAAPTELQEYRTLLKNYLAYNPKRDGYNVAEQADKFLQTYPGTRLVSNVKMISSNSKGQADAWVNQGIKRIENQAGERKGQESAVAGGTDPGGAAQPGGTAPSGAALTTGSGQAAVTSSAPVSNNATAPKEEYDKNKAAAPPQVEEASRQAAQDMRQKAAELFVRANNTRDTDEKRKLLLSARDLLQGILVKYPQSGLTDKVQRNLARIDTELRAVDASAAPRPVSSGGAYVPPKTGSGGATGSL